jgi:hypothetical protein
VLQFARVSYADLPNTHPVYVPDLLARWPKTIPERIERCFCHLINSKFGRASAGHELEITSERERDLLVFADWHTEQDYFIKAMIDYKWLAERRMLDNDGRESIWICVTPKGWAHFDELNRGQGDAKNPVFVAMWFGGKERKEEMDTLYEEAIKPAIKGAGYNAERADTDDYNDAIMDKVIDDIRRAPFVVADLTSRNNGVYYEAGFAGGYGKEVILCCPESDKKQHFDVSGLNQLRYHDAAQLRISLERRILRTMGRGPHPFDGGDTSGDG